jgi:hypothetical protein
MKHISEPQMTAALHQKWPALIGDNSKEWNSILDIVQRDLY